MKVHDFSKMKRQSRKISMITCYDYTMAQLVAQSDIDCILVGDSVAMVVHGYDSTLPCTVDMIAMHTRAVVKGAPKKFVVADLPFLSYRKSLANTMDNVHQFMACGAQAVKLEGAEGNLETVAHIVESGIPVMGHIGLTPQSVHQLSGFRVQGKDDASATRLLKQAQLLQAAGCFAIVLECVPSQLAVDITASLDIATIGIGAGSATDGQVLVSQDLLGLNPGFSPKFLKQYLSGATLTLAALNCYDKEVKAVDFPALEHSF